MASRIIKGQLDGPLAAKLTGVAWCVTFVTIGELWQWATMRSWGRRSREELEQWLGRVVALDSDEATARAWGRISAEARRRGRARPANDTWIAACCLAHGLPLATLNLKDFGTVARISESLAALGRGEPGADLATVRQDLARRRTTGA